MEIFENLNLQNIDYTIENLAKGEYEACTFINCNFANVDLSYFVFIDCIFDGCNMSLTKVHQVLFREVRFISSKMIGLQFGTANEFGLSISIDTCTLSNASFYKTKLKETIFKNSKMNDVDFSDADLSGAVFENCDLFNAIFDNTNLVKADFRTSVNYSIDADRNKINKSKHATAQLGGLLEKYKLEIE
jgi:uncharacterized protein YjbI with pentapeptide repeats